MTRTNVVLSNIVKKIILAFQIYHFLWLLLGVIGTAIALFMLPHAASQDVRLALFSFLSIGAIVVIIELFTFLGLYLRKPWAIPLLLGVGMLHIIRFFILPRYELLPILLLLIGLFTLYIFTRKDVRSYFGFTLSFFKFK